MDASQNPRLAKCPRPTPDLLLVPATPWQLDCVYLAPGTQVFVGPIANQGVAWVGGGIQVWVPRK
jgi:hypothetical protein